VNNDTSGGAGLFGFWHWLAGGVRPGLQEFGHAGCSNEAAEGNTFDGILTALTALTAASQPEDPQSPEKGVAKGEKGGREANNIKDGTLGLFCCLSAF
jgi:hypothetical protein